MNDVSLLEDQEAVLRGLVVPIARRENVDAVLIAGDVYQRAPPQAEAVAATIAPQCAERRPR